MPSVEAITKRIVATLKHDPDLLRFEEEAEEAVSELSAGDEKVKQTLDQLIDSHHDLGHAFAEGVGASAGDSATAGSSASRPSTRLALSRCCRQTLDRPPNIPC